MHLALLSVMMMIYSTFSEGLLISLFSIIIVFLILGFVALMVSLLKYFVVSPTVEQVSLSEPFKKALSLSDITDEDMMVAALVASIDYYNEVKKDVRVISVREIKANEGTPS